jgi:hypothetical protein
MGDNSNTNPAAITVFTSAGGSMRESAIFSPLDIIQARDQVSGLLISAKLTYHADVFPPAIGAIFSNVLDRPVDVPAAVATAIAIVV